MRFGLLTAILEGTTFEEAVDFASANGLECLEVACWPNSGGAKRRYAGVCHIDAEALTPEKAEYYKDYCLKRGVVISSLGYYPNTLDPDLEKRKTYIDHIHALIDASALLGVNMVTTFLGRDPGKTVEANLELVKEVWPSILDHAKEKNVRIAIENCPMLFTNDQWPGGQNLMTTPANWRRAFELIPSPNLQICYDPSHFIWQMIDPIAPIFEFANRLAACHAKDIILRRDKLQQVGIMATPLQFMQPVIPGHGDVPWSKYFEALYSVGFTGTVALEFEDKTFEGDDAVTHNAIRAAKRHLDQFVV